MVNFVDHGFVLSIKKFNEKGRIIKCFLKENGVVSGFLENSKRDITLQSITYGSFVKANWYSKISDQLGRYKIECENRYDIYQIIFDKNKNILLSNAILLFLAFLPEREINITLWNYLYRFIEIISMEKDLLYCMCHYSLLEMQMLHMYKSLVKSRFIELLTGEEEGFNTQIYEKIISENDRNVIIDEISFISRNVDKLLEKHGSMLTKPYIRGMLERLILGIPF